MPGTQWSGMVWMLLCLSLASCFGGTSKPARFYMLQPMSSAHVDQSNSPTVRISLEPVAIPRYLNRPQIVTLKHETEYRLDEFNQWLEPLGDNLTRVLAENLSALLAPDGMDVQAMARSANPDFRMSVELLRLDGGLGKQAVLVARWSLVNPYSGEPPLTRRVELEEPVNGDGYASYVEALNRLVGSLSQRMADAIRITVKSK